MRVRMNIAVIAFLAIYRTDGDNRSIFFKLSEVAVNRAKGKIRVKRFQSLVDPLGSGVAGCGANGL